MSSRIKHLFYGIAVLLLVFAETGSALAKSVSGLRFNEILVYNDSSIVDDYGRHSAWIEIYNSTSNSVDIGGCYLTDDLNNPTKYCIQDGNPGTSVPGKGFIIFFADHQPQKGLSHLNFDLKNAKNIALFDADGILIDKLDIPQPQKADVTYGKTSEYENTWAFLTSSTPGTKNENTSQSAQRKAGVANNSSGFEMALTAMLVIFGALTLLLLVYKVIGKIFFRRASKTRDAGFNKETEMSGELNAAIATALFLYQNEMHDQENTVLTIQKVSRNYSPWSSKIYMLRKNPR